jgi:hypothetical protein
MHGDKYELRVDGMSFSHMYSISKAKHAFDRPEQFNEYGREPYGEGGLGAYGDEVYGQKEKPTSDPFGWDENQQRKP